MEKELAELKECLEKRSPILYVGAGFSIGCKNKNDMEVKSASGLCELLYNHFWIEKTNENQETAENFQTRNSLKDLCQLLKIMGLAEERDEYLTDYFSGCYIEFDDARNNICKYPWSKIFTVNIDDLIESIYSRNSQKINIWNKNKDFKKHSINCPTLIKLHGCVNNPIEGYIFDEEEYKRFLTEENYLISEFGDAYSKNDIIFLGTEFNEEDLTDIISKYNSKGYEASSVNQFYFVTPTINNVLTRLTIEKAPNMHHIKMYADDFFKFIQSQITYSNELYNKLKENGLINVYEIYSNTLANYESKLYHGHDITYGDLKYNWDVTEHSDEIMDWIKRDDHNKLIAIHGKEYVGKTCVAKRLLYNLFIVDYECYEFELNSEYRIDLFIEYITSNCNKDVAVLFDGASYLYELLVQKVVNSNPYDHRIIIITTDNTINHRKKYHSLLKNDNCCIITTSEQVDNHKAELIYDKLQEKHSLSNWLDVSNERDTIIKHMTDNNDIIDIIYLSSRGRGFENHIDTFILSDIKKNSLSSKQIALFCLFGKLGITNVPKSLYDKCARAIDHRFNSSIFPRIFSKLIQNQYESYHLRYMRYLTNAYSNEFSNDEIKRVIITSVGLYAGRFEECEYNEFSSILYKILNIKSLKKLLSYTEIKDLYMVLEKKCNKYSYYWVQRGLCAQNQKKPDYEEADRFLREAREINPSSYQVTHAIAKNLINRGLDINNPNDDYYNEGISQMLALLDNDHFSRAYGYSLHSYIDSTLKYRNMKNSLLSDVECLLINNYVQKLNENEIKGVLSNLLYDLKKYAKRNGLMLELSNVTGYFWKQYNLTEEEKDDSLESDFNF